MSHLARSFLVVLATGVPAAAAAQARAQADVQIQAFNVQLRPAAARPVPITKTTAGASIGGQVSAPTLAPSSSVVAIDVTVFSNNDDDAGRTRVLIFLPPESGILNVPAGCQPSPGGTGVNGTYHAFLSCDLGDLPVNGSRTISFTTSVPPAYIPKRYGVFAYSNTPDPGTGNNYAERTLP